MPSKQAEAITAAITEVLNDSLENVAQSFVSKAEMQKVCCLQSLINYHYCHLLPSLHVLSFFIHFFIFYLGVGWGGVFTDRPK